MAAHRALTKVTWSGSSRSVPSSSPLGLFCSSAPSPSSQRESRQVEQMHSVVYSLCVVCQCFVFPPPLHSPVGRVHAAVLLSRGATALTLLLPAVPSGVLSQFTLVLWGTGPSALNPSSSDFPRPSNNSCKTFDAQQICIGEVLTQTHLHTPGSERVREPLGAGGAHWQAL